MGETLPLVVPVRYSGGGLTMQTTTSRVGEDRLFVRGIVTPKQGATVALRITLPPGAAQPIEARGTVTECVAPGVQGREAGFWVKLEAIAGDGRDLLQATLRDRQTPAGGVKRAFARVPAHLQISWSTPRDFLVAYADNISKGGVFVVTPDPPPLGEIVELSMQLPDGEAPVKTAAQVIQRIAPEQARHLGREPGAGLQFVGADDEFRRRLDLCIDHLWKTPAP